MTNSDFPQTQVLVKSVIFLYVLYKSIKAITRISYTHEVYKKSVVTF